MFSKPWLLLILISVSFQCAYAIKVMGIFSMPLKSHYMAFKPLFIELALRGHSVTVLSNYPHDKLLDNFEDVYLNSTDVSVRKTSKIAEFEELAKEIHYLKNFYRHVDIGEILAKDCNNLFTNSEAKRLVDSGKKFDVIIVEQFLSDCGAVFAGVHYDGVPLIGITSHVLLPWSYPKLGLPFRYSEDAFYFSPAGRDITSLQKLLSVAMGTYFNTFAKWQNHKQIKSSLDTHMPNNQFDVESMTKNFRMMFSYQHFSLTGARPLAPQVLEIGGLHVGKPKSLPMDLETFISKSKYGVIYVSFGSMLEPSTMTATRLEDFLAAFRSVPQSIVWKLDNITVLQTQDTRKIFARSWLPQLDILCHPNVIAFVSHGGMLGTSEAMSCGVPVVAVPFFGDQFANSASIRDSGLGRQLPVQDITTDTLLEALRDVTSQERRSRAKLLSSLWNERPQSPMEAALYWTEYVAKFGKYSPPALSKHVTVWQDWLLDVWVLAGGIFVIILMKLYLMIKAVKYFVMKMTKNMVSKLKVQ